jgi:serine protease Do
MQAERHRLFSLAAVAVAAVLFGMVIAGALNVTPSSDAQRPVEATSPATEAAPSTMAAPDFATLADRVVPSVVSVFNTEVQEPGERRRGMPRDPFHFFFGPRERDEGDQDPVVRTSSGSGFFISESGEVVTNYHVIEDADRIRIELDDGREFEAKVVGRDPETDIALLQVTEGEESFPALRLGVSDALRVGEWVMAVGNPLNMDHTVTVGVVSAKGRVLGISGDRAFENFIQTDAAINFGNSGGPLVNTRGEVVAINTAINVRGQNLGFAVPVETLERILPQLRETGRVVRGYLGVMVSEVDERRQEAFDLPGREGAFVEDVVAGQAADQGGVRPGDVVVTVDGKPVRNTRDLIDEVSALPPGTEVELEVIRDGEQRKLTVELDQRPSSGSETELGDDPDEDASSTERVGISVTEVTPRVRSELDLDDSLDGVLVTRVRPFSPAGEENLRRGDIITQANGSEVGSVQELMAAIDDVEEGGYLRLYVYRPQAEQSFFAILQLE